MNGTRPASSLLLSHDAIGPVYTSKICNVVYFVFSSTSVLFCITKYDDSTFKTRLVSGPLNDYLIERLKNC